MLKRGVATVSGLRWRVCHSECKRLTMRVPVRLTGLVWLCARMASGHEKLLLGLREARSGQGHDVPCGLAAVVVATKPCLCSVCDGAWPCGGHGWPLARHRAKAGRAHRHEGRNRHRKESGKVSALGPDVLASGLDRAVPSGVVKMLSCYGWHWPRRGVVQGHNEVCCRRDAEARRSLDR